MPLQNLPVLRARSRGRLDYGVRPLVRGFGLAAGLAFAVIGTRWSSVDAVPRLLFYCVAFILLLSAASENRWSFYAAGPAADCKEGPVGAACPPEVGAAAETGRAEVYGGARRRFGILPFTRSWELPISRLSSVSLRAGRAGESPDGIATDRDRVEASIYGMGRYDWVALVLALDDGRSLTLASGKTKIHARLRSDGEAIAAHLGLAFVDSSGLDEPPAS